MALSKTITTLLGTALPSLFVFAALLGENHKIDDTITAYLEAGDEYRFDALCDSKPPVISIDDTPVNQPCLASNMLLALSLKQHFGLLGQNKYDVQLERSHFWLPGLTDDRVRVNLALSPVPDANWFSGDEPPKADASSLAQLFTLERNNGLWQIVNIRLTQAPLTTHYQQLADLWATSPYLSTDKTGFHFKKTSIRPETLSALDKELLRVKLTQLTNQLR